MHLIETVLLLLVAGIAGSYLFPGNKDKKPGDEDHCPR